MATVIIVTGHLGEDSEYDFATVEEAGTFAAMVRHLGYCAWLDIP